MADCLLGHMSTTPLSGLVEASKIATSFVSGLTHSLPFLVACLSVSAFVAVTHPEERVRYICSAGGVFFVAFLAMFRWVHSRKRSHAIWAVKHATLDQKIVLQRYLKEDRSVCNFSVFHGPSASLIGQGVLVHATGTFPAFDAPVAIQPFIMEYLRKHPDLIGLKHDDIGRTPPIDE